MKMFYKLIFGGLFILSALVFTSCHNMCTDLEKVIGERCWIEKLEWVNVADKTSIQAGSSSKFSSSLQNGRYVITSTGSGNWMFSSLGRDIKGVEVEVKINSGSYAGFELFAHDSYAKYAVQIRSDKSVYVYYDQGTVDSKEEYILKKKATVENPLAYNKIRLEIQADRSSKVYINDTFLCSIPDHSLHYGAIAVLSGGNCNFKLNKIQH